MIWISIAILLACAAINKKAMGWIEWSRSRRNEVNTQIAEVRRINEYLNP